uniref:Caveolae associated protein 1a n=1 Tax=Oryzias sinensis TaxID=183150 RepID=A0A8C7WQU1_9TELE
MRASAVRGSTPLGWLASQSKAVPYDDEEVALVGAASESALDDISEEADLVLATGSGGASEAQRNGVMVLALLDKIIGVVDNIQHTQNGLEARQEAMEKSVSTIQGELTKLSKNHVDTAKTVNKMLDKVRKVSVNIKTVRSNLEKQAGQIKKLETNENELLKRRNFKVLIYQVTACILVEEREGVQAGVNSDEEVEIEEIIEESRTKRLQRTTKQQVENIKKAFSKEKMEKTKQKTKENLERTKKRTRENLEKTRQRTRDNLEKTKHSLEMKIDKLGTRMTPNQERRAKMKTYKEKVKKSLTPDHAINSRSKTTVYRVPPFTFHVKKVREGEEEEVAQNTEMVEVTEGEAQLGEEENGLGVHVEIEEGKLVDIDNPERQTLLEVTEDSQLVSVEPEYLKKAQSK